MQVHPTVIIGLGDVGTAVARLTLGHVRANHERVVPFVVSLSVEADGVGLRGLPLESNTVTRLQTGGRLSASWDALETDVQLGVWARNHKRINAERKRIAGELQRAVQGVRDFGRSATALRTHDELTLSNEVDFWVIAELSCPVGSAALIPVLSEIGSLFDRRFQSLSRRVNLLLLTPDLVPERSSDLASARVFAGLQELEWALEPERREAIYVSHVWMASAQNEDDLFVGSYRDLATAISRFVVANVAEGAMRDQSFGVAMQGSIHGRRRRYSSFGYSQIAFPREELVNAATAVAVADVFRDHPAFCDATFEAASVFADTQEFIQKHGMDRLADRLGERVGGGSIWQSFEAPRPPDGPAAARADVDAIELAARSFEREHMTEMQRAIVARRADLVGSQRSAILGEVHRRLDEREAGARRAAAWLAALEGRPSPYVEGDTENFPITLRAVDEEIKAYFDNLFERTLFDDTAEDVAEYLRAHPAARGGRRNLLRQLEYDLETKRRNVETLRAKAADLESVLDKNRPATSPSGDMSDEASDTEVEVNSDSSASTYDGDRTVGYDGTDEPDDVTMETGGPSTRSEALSSGAMVAKGDGDIRDATRRAAEEERWRQAESELEENERAQGAYALDIEVLEDIAHRTRDEIAQLDRAIEDASERRRLYEPIRKAGAEKERGLEAKYLRAASDEQGARSRAREMTGQLRRVIAKASLLFIFVVVVAGALGWAVEGELTGAFWVWLASGAALGICGSFLYYFLTYARPYAVLLRDVEALKAQRTSERKALVNHIDARFRSEVEYVKHGALVDWRDRLVRWTRELEKSVDAMPGAVTEATAKRAQYAHSFTLPSDATTEYVYPENGVVSLLDGKKRELSIAADDYWKEEPLSSTFEALRGTGADGIQDAIARAEIRIRSCFTDFSSMSVEEFIERAAPEPSQRVELVRKVYRRAAPFASFSADGAAHAPPEHMTFVGLEEPDVMGPVKESLRSLGVSPIAYDAPSSTAVPVFRTNLGFAAFQLAQASTGRFAFDELSADDRREMYINEGWADRVEDLLPSAYLLGDEDDEVRKITCLALAFGLASRDDATGAIGVNGHSFESYPAWVAHLRGFEGEEEFVELRGSVEAKQALMHQAAELQPDDEDVVAHVERLNEYSKRSDVDEVDIAILQRELWYYSLN